MREPQKWLTIEEDEYILVIPESDIKPHGFPKEGELRAQLAEFDCPCKPKISIGGKMIIVHNSFLDMERIEKSLTDNFKGQ